MKYADKLIKMQGIIISVKDGAVEIDLRGRLGYMKIPMRMLITDYKIEEGQEIAFMMSFPEVISEKKDPKYIKNKSCKNIIGETNNIKE